jgi:hypothetical protein
MKFTTPAGGLRNLIYTPRVTRKVGSAKGTYSVLHVIHKPPGLADYEGVLGNGRITTGNDDD